MEAKKRELRRKKGGGWRGGGGKGGKGGRKRYKSEKISTFSIVESQSCIKGCFQTLKMYSIERN